MITNPELYIDEFVKAGAEFISVHQETCPHMHRVIAQIKEQGCKASIALNPATPLSSIEEILPQLDMVLLMSVNPGFGGQSFIPSVLDKCRLLSEVREREGMNFMIEVDGGVNTENSGDLIEAGVDVLVAGNAIFKTDNYQESIESIRNGSSRE